MAAYGQSKIANILHANELSRHLKVTDPPGVCKSRIISIYYLSFRSSVSFLHLTVMKHFDNLSQSWNYMCVYMYIFFGTGRRVEYYG